MKKQLLISFAVLIANSAWSQANLAVPATANTTPSHYVKSLQAYWYQPKSKDFAASASRLREAIETACDENARKHWRESVLSWSQFSAVLSGALISRRSAWRINFLPIRTARIEEAVAGSLPAENIGAAAKGFGALEWLLWIAPKNNEHCSYATRIAIEMEDEARALNAAFSAPNLADNEAMITMMGVFFNQWVGAVNTLRIESIIRPFAEAKSRGLVKPLYLRPYANPDINVAERLMRWDALKTLALGGDVPSKPISIADYLRGIGQHELAKRFEKEIMHCDVIMKKAEGDSKRLEKAAIALAEIQQLVEKEVMPSLGIHVSFSDGDGD